MAKWDHEARRTLGHLRRSVIGDLSALSAGRVVPAGLDAMGVESYDRRMMTRGNGASRETGHLRSWVDSSSPEIAAMNDMTPEQYFNRHVQIEAENLVYSRDYGVSRGKALLVELGARGRGLGPDGDKAVDLIAGTQSLYEHDFGEMVSVIKENPGIALEPSAWLALSRLDEQGTISEQLGDPVLNGASAVPTKIKQAESSFPDPFDPMNATTPQGYRLAKDRQTGFDRKPVDRAPGVERRLGDALAAQQQTEQQREHRFRDMGWGYQVGGPSDAAPER